MFSWETWSITAKLSIVEGKLMQFNTNISTMEGSE